MKRFFPAIFLFSLIFSPQLFTMDWPSVSAQMIKNFGWNDEGKPHLGISFNAEGVLEAADEGELLFRRRENDTASRLPSPLGAWTAVDHRDGIISIYGRYDDSLQNVPGRVQRNMPLGEAGISGWSSQKGFYFQLFDRRERRWINPSLIINPFEDNRQPVILSVRLRDEQDRFFNPSQIRTLDQGRYTVIVDAVDTMRGPGESPLAPHRIICSVNGREAGILAFETYSARDGSLRVYRNGLEPAKKIYSPYPAYEIADLWFSRGQTTLEIIAQDIAGNVRNVVYRIVTE